MTFAGNGTKPWILCRLLLEDVQKPEMAGEMRLICPNCDAEYEVDAALIPEAGRDVQCSNCGHAWFQASPLVEAEVEAEEALFAPGGGVAAQAVADMVAEGGAVNVDGDEAEEPSQQGTATAPAATRNIDASVLSVLREEAERESRARAQDAAAMETQTEMGLQGRAPGTDSAVNSRIARMKGEAEANSQPLDPGARAAAKREMLPEIDTINSSLRARSERRPGDGAAVAETMGKAEARQSGFRTGFVLSVMLIAVALTVYILAPKLAEMMPGLAGPLSSYVALVDGLRLMVDGVLQSLIAKITGWTGVAS